MSEGGDKVKGTNEKISLILAYSWSSGRLFVHILRRKEEEHWCQMKTSKIVNNSHAFLCQLFCMITLIAFFRALEVKRWLANCRMNFCPICQLEDEDFIYQSST